LEQCFDLIKEYEDIKFTLFVPVAYWRTLGHTATKGPLFIHYYKDFCNIIKKIPSKNFEIGYHGYHHGIPGITNNDEFHKINFETADKLFKLMFDVVKRAGLSEVFKPIFRPPAWKMSKDAINASKENSIKILALSPRFPHEEEFDKIVYATCNPPFDPLEFSEKTEIVYHACEWDRNYLNKDMSESLKDFLSSERENIEFCFMEGML